MAQIVWLHLTVRAGEQAEQAGSLPCTPIAEAIRLAELGLLRPSFFLLQTRPLLPSASVGTVTSPVSGERLHGCLLHTANVLYLFPLAGGTGGCLKEDGVSNVSELTGGSVYRKAGVAQLMEQRLPLTLFSVLIIQSCFLCFLVTLLFPRANSLFEPSGDFQ